MTFKARLFKYYWLIKIAGFSGLNLIPLKSMAKVQQIPLKHNTAVQNKQVETMLRSPIHFIYISSDLMCVYVYTYIYINTHINTCTHTDGGLQKSKIYLFVF